MRGRSSVARGEWLILAGIVVLAAALRLVSLPSRGAWDADQGAQLLAVRAMVADGHVPLLGPAITWLPGVSHGALYYDLLAPAAWLSDTDPTVVVLTIVLAGLGAVVATWWLGRLLGGPLAAVIAGALMAVSAAEVGSSTFIWNPTLLPLAGALVFAGATWAWTSRRRAGWIIAAIGLVLAMQAHLLGALLLLPLAVLYVLDVRRARRPAARRRLLVAGLWSVAILVLGHAQLIVNELTTGLSQTRAVVAFLSGGAGTSTGGEPDPLVRLVVVALRILSWPFAGLFIDAFVPAVVVATLTLVILAWCLRASRGQRRVLFAWLAGTLAWCWVLFAIAVPSLATVVRELPVDHYHAFLDPLVVAIVAVGAAAALERAGPGRVVAAVAVGGLIAFGLATQPPLVAPDGGWPLAEQAAARVKAIAGDREVAVIELPSFKGPEAYTFPLARDGATVVATPAQVGAGGHVVIVCEDTFREAIGRACGGPAEDAAIAAAVASPRLVERFLAAPGRHISIYVIGQ